MDPKPQFPGVEPGIYSDLKQFQTHLVSEAHRALSAPTFAERNDTMAAAVGLESSVLAGKALTGVKIDKRPDILAGLKTIFTQASQEAGQEFAPAFDETGRPLTENKTQYDQAMSAAGAVAFKYLPDALKAIGLDMDLDGIKEILRKVDFRDIVTLTMYEIGRKFMGGALDIGGADNLSVDEIRASLHANAKGDYFEGKIDGLPIPDAQERESRLNETEYLVLGMAIRLANATWKAGQVHRAAWEGNDSRIDSSKRGGVFNPFDLLKRQQFEEYRGKTSDKEALLRVAFEIWKDKVQYDSLV